MILRRPVEGLHRPLEEGLQRPVEDLQRPVEGLQRPMSYPDDNFFQETLLYIIYKKLG